MGWEELDLSSPDEICKRKREIRPHLIVNAAAYTAVDEAEKDEAAARAINAHASAVMTQEAEYVPPPSIAKIEQEILCREPGLFHHAPYQFALRRPPLVKSARKNKIYPRPFHW